MYLHEIIPYMFYIDRIPFFLLSYFVCLKLFSKKPSKFHISKKKLKHSSRKYILYSFIISLVFYYIMLSIPYERQYITFDSVESAFRYANSTDQIDLVLEIDDNAFIIAHEGSNRYYTCWTQKKNGQWLYPHGDIPKEVHHVGDIYISQQNIKSSRKTMFSLFIRSSVGGVQTVFNLQDMNHAFLVMPTPPKISDNIHGEFSKHILYYEEMDDKSSSLLFYYSIIDHDTDGYMITIDEKEYLIN